MTSLASAADSYVRLARYARLYPYDMSARAASIMAHDRMHDAAQADGTDLEALRAAVRAAAVAIGAPVPVVAAYGELGS